MWRPFSLIVLLCSSQSIFAQQVIQQPVVGTTTVNTTVSVPDRGSTFLGGTSSAQSGRSQYGPLRSGTSSGYSRQHTSMSTSVYIHDLRAMDEAILNSRPAMTSDQRRTVGSTGLIRRDREQTADVAVSPMEKAAKYEDLAQKAEKAGKAGLAKLHWQMAAKYGSKLADTRLAELSQPSSATGMQAAKAH